MVYEQQEDEVTSASQQQEVVRDPSGREGDSQRPALKPPRKRSQ